MYTCVWIVSFSLYVCDFPFMFNSDYWDFNIMMMMSFEKVQCDTSPWTEKKSLLLYVCNVSSNPMRYQIYLTLDIGYSLLYTQLPKLLSPAHIHFQFHLIGILWKPIIQSEWPQHHPSWFSFVQLSIHFLSKKKEIK